VHFWYYLDSFQTGCCTTDLNKETSLFFILDHSIVNTTPISVKARQSTRAVKSAICTALKMAMGRFYATQSYPNHDFMERSHSTNEASVAANPTQPNIERQELGPTLGLH